MQKRARGHVMRIIFRSHDVLASTWYDKYNVRNLYKLKLRKRRRANIGTCARSLYVWPHGGFIHCNLYEERLDFFSSSLASTDICAVGNIAIISYSFIHLYRVPLSFLPRCKSRENGQRKFGSSSRKWRAV